MNTTLTLPVVSGSIPCFLCGKPVFLRLDKHGKPYFVCDPCGIQCFVRRRQGIEQLASLLDKLKKKKLAFEKASEEVFELQARLAEIDGLKAEIKKLQDRAGFLFPDGDLIRARDVLKARVEGLIDQLASDGNQK
jgi:hypothetical protein